jgi:hypothetical protein
MTVNGAAPDVAPIVARERIGLVIAAALLVAGLVFVGAVLPAEYGIDPIGTGRLLGLTPLGDLQKQMSAFETTRAGDAPTAQTIVAADRKFAEETRTFTLEPRGFIEYKYRLDKGQALFFSWAASAAVNVEFHAEPDGAPAGFAETYEKKSGVTSASGTLTAPFSGIHGWYWENTTDAPVTVTLSSAGFYRLAYEFRKEQPAITKTFQ